MTPLVHPWDAIVLGIEIFLFAYFVLCNGFYVLTALVALAHLPWFMKVHRVDPVRRTHSSLDQPVTMIVPAYNEEHAILTTVRSLLAMEYAASEVVVVNDGSTDDTLPVLMEAYDLEPYPGVYRATLATAEVRQIYSSAKAPQLRVVDKAHAGKADALNAGINVAHYPLVLACDADTYYHPSALQWMTEPFQKDPRTVVVGGAIGVGNELEASERAGKIVPSLPRRQILRFQALEYLRAFLANRLGWAPFNGLGIISGASGLWRKDVLIRAGGYRNDTVWEDMEMTLRVHHLLLAEKTPYRIGFTPYPVCWTHVPQTAGALFHQRKLWHRHLSECISIHRRLLLRGNVLGWMTMPYLAFFEWLAPAVVTFGIAFGCVGIAFHFLDWTSQLWLLGLVLMLAVLMSIVTILLDEMSFTAYRLRDIWALMWTAVIENFGYRQFVGLASLAGLGAWMVRQKHHGGKPPGPFVHAYDPRRHP